jgi:endo-1,3(4)-beta-glucanase
MTLLNKQNQPYQPFSTQKPNLTEKTHPEKPTSLWGNFTDSPPLPTNRWWEDLVLKNKTTNRIGENRIATYPYTYKLLEDQIVVNVPPLQVIPRDVPEKIYGSVIGVDLKSMCFSVKESFKSHQLTGFDFLSSNWEYEAGSGKVSVPMFRGSAYVTFQCEKVTPTITCPLDAILKINDSTQPGQVGPAAKFVIEKNNGQTWVLYTSSEVTITWYGPEPSWGINFDSEFSGTVRLALVKAEAPQWYGKVDNDINILDAHKDVIPTGVDVQAYVTGNTVTVAFKWKVNGSGDLLMTALPHHLKVLQDPDISSGISFPVPVGTMKGIIGNTWTMEYEIPDIDFTASNPIKSSLVNRIKSALPGDITAQEALCNGTTDVYSSGQSAAGIALMAIVAHEVGDEASAQKALTFCKSFLEKWLTGKDWNGDSLVYDKTWGGVVTSKGLPDSGADYGNGYYNDHHFQYGYFIYTAAVIGNFDPDWLDQNKEAVLNLVRDIANPSSSDPYFTCLRHKDMFRSNSWTLGLFTMGDGRNQESSSEAVNAWYAVTLLGKAMENQEIEDIGKILLVTEILSAREYWQIPNSNINFPPQLASFGVATNNWSTKIDLATWFGYYVEFCFGIEALPFTPIAGALINPDWPKDHWAEIQERIDSGITPDWLEYMYMLQSTFSPSQAEENMISNPPSQYHIGTSESLTWYFIATRPE